MPNKEVVKSNFFSSTFIPALLSAIGALLMIAILALITSSLIISQILSESSMLTISYLIAFIACFISGKYAIKKGKNISSYLVTSLTFLCLMLMLLLGSTIVSHEVEFDKNSLLLICSIAGGFLTSNLFKSTKKNRRKKKH